MDPKEIQSVWKAFQEVQEKKKLDPVGKEDGDIDNDGDKDSSDEYLANRRKAVSKSMKKDDVKEGELPPALKKNAEKKKKEAGKDEEEVEEASCDSKTRKEEDEEECPKCKGKGCDHCDGKGYHMKETPAAVLGAKKMKESSLFTDAELEAIEEKAKQPNDSGTKAEPFMSTNSAGEKKFYADHEKGSEKKYEDWEETSENDGSAAGRAVKSQSPKRRGENRAGDIAMPTPTKAKGQ